MSEKQNYLDLVIPRQNPRKSKKLTDLSLRKKVSMQIVFRREGLNPHTLKTVYGYFTQTIELRVLNEKRYFGNWLCLCNGNFYLQQNVDKSGNLLSDLAPCSEFVPIPSTCEQFGIVMSRSKAVRISREKASELLRSGIPLKSESLIEVEVS